MHVRGHERSIPYKFRKHPSSGSVVKDMTMCSHTFLFTDRPEKKLGRGR